MGLCVRIMAEQGTPPPLETPRSWRAGATDLRGRSALDAVLESCSDARMIQLNSVLTDGSGAATERQLLCLVELLVGARAPCRHFLAEHCGLGRQSSLLEVLVHRRLALAVGQPGWSPASHRLWPVAFQRAAREALVAMQGRGAAAEGPGEAAKQAAMALAPGPPRICLPTDICCLILARASLPVSFWMDAEV